ncbi:hypothetical protein NTJ56_08735 [Burkholderia contaminans]|uniref:hypothetical protein n=1 Tax=Burkholderia contaminans TaxID=488447 RepID=UPI0021500AC3|nr:hypothetical protein [Burkholderia contaminans]UUX38872.1 hypothetical protein NTJ56_08735 [Burkholderia contaminans]
MSDLTAAPSSTEPSVEELASIAMGTNASASPQEAGTAASGESTAAAQVAGAALDLSAPSASAEIAQSTPSAGAADMPVTGDDPNAGAFAAAQPSIDAAASAPAASPSAGTSSTDASSLAERLLGLPHRVAQHLESIYELVTDHVRQAQAPADVAKAELALEIDDLLHKLSNGIAVSDGRIVAKLAALRAML